MLPVPIGDEEVKKKESRYESSFNGGFKKVAANNVPRSDCLRPVLLVFRLRGLQFLQGSDRPRLGKLIKVLSSQ